MVGFCGEVEITRRCANHHPSVWGDHFLTYANLLVINCLIYIVNIIHDF